MSVAEKAKTTCAICGTAVDDSSADLGCPTCLFQTGLDENAEHLGIRALPDQLDDQFGPYTISKRDDGTPWVLGRGAMGVTYRAMDASLRRPVALKIIQSDLKTSNAEARERFLREARAAATLQHQNVATAYHFGIREETGQYYYAMELIEGETLEERVRRTGPLEVGTVAEIARQITAALAEAQKCGLVHRDLKPANLMLVVSNEKGERDRQSQLLRVKVIDFGLAKAIKGENDPMWLTRGGFVGTPAFASPEQLDRAPLDIRSDIYSLGVTLWFSLTGKTPFPAPSLDEIRRAQQSQALPVDQLRAAHVPSWMIALLKSMLAVEPAARPGLTLLDHHLRRGTARGKILRLRSSFALAAIVIVLAMLAFSLWRSPQTSNSNTRAAPPEASLAILPFSNLSREADGVYFVNGIRTQIIARLSKVAALELISDSSTHRFEGSKEDVGQIAAALGVTTLLRGSVERNGDNFRVKVRLIDARKHVDLWSQSYERPFSQIPKVESEVARQVASTLGVKLTGPESSAISAATTSNPKAYEAYLKGRFVWLQRTTDGFRQAKEYFDQAIALDPNYAEAYAGLADAYQFMGAFDFYLQDRKENYEKAKQACQRALKIDPNLAEAHASLGLIAMNYDYDWALTEQELRRALTLAPNNGLIHDWYAEYLMAVGRPDGAVAEMERARELDPLSSVINTDLGKMRYFARRYDEAEKQLKQAILMAPDFDLPHAWLGYLYVSCGRWDEAITEFQVVRRKVLSTWASGLLAYAYGMAGRTAEAEQMLNLTKNTFSRGIQIDKLPLAWAYLGVGDKDHAIACLEQDYESHSTSIVGLKSNPWFDPLRSDPRFTDLMCRVHLVP